MKKPVRGQKTGGDPASLPNQPQTEAGSKQTDGFSLIELMVAVAIIGILAIIAVPNFRAYKEKARIAACLTTAYSIQASLISYAAATAAGTFPDSASLSSWGDLVSICNPNGSHLTETAYESGFQDWVSYDSVETSGKTDSFTLLLRLNDVTHTTECSQLEITARSVARQTY